MTEISFSLGLNLSTWQDAGGNAYKVFDKSGTTALPSGSYIQLVVKTASSLPLENLNLTQPDPQKPGFLHSETEYNPNTYKVGSQNTGVTAVAGVAGEFDYNFDSSLDGSGAKDVFVRIWNAAAPATDAFYNDTKVRTNGPGTPPKDLLVNLSTTYKAAKPALPTVSVNNISLKYDSTSRKYLPAFTLTAQTISKTADDNNVQVVGYKIRWRKLLDANWISTNGQSTSTSETNPTTPYIFMGGSYEAQAQAYNYFGTYDTDADWGTILPFSIPLGEGGGASYEVTYNLKKYERTKLVVNDISSPKQTVAKDLAAKINAVVADSVSAICKWNTGSGTYEVYIPNSDETFVGTNFNIISGEGVQVYVSKDVNNLVLNSQ